MALTDTAASAFRSADHAAGDSTDSEAAAIVAALRGVAIEVAALREALTPPTTTKED